MHTRSWAVVTMMGIASAAAAAPAALPANLQALGHQTMLFEANRGQHDARARFAARGPGYHLFLTGDGAALSLHAGTHPGVMLHFVGANPSTQFEGLAPRAARLNYFAGNDPAAWHTGVPTFERVRARGMYPGIDLVYYGSDGRLEYDLVVGRGADPSRIALRFDGAERVRIDDQGDLRITVDGGELTQHRPRVYQQVGDRRVELSARYVRRPDGRIGFDLGRYDRRRAVVIDPVFEFVTYIGGGGEDKALGVAVDPAGNVYIAGETQSQDFPALTNLAPLHGSGRDAFLTKFTPSGDVVYSTFLTGSSPNDQDDFATGVAVDAKGAVYLTGTTHSSTFPTAGSAASTALNPGAGGQDAFITKIAPSGDAIVFSGFVGGAGTDTANGITLDATGNIYLVGETSGNFTQNGGGFNSPSTGLDVFFAKLFPTGAFAYAGEIGGTGNDVGSGIAVDAAGSAYLTGFWTGAGLPAGTTTGLKPASSNRDCFLIKLAADGKSVAYSTYLGGDNATDACDGIALTGTNHVVLVGITSSTDFPMPGNPVPSPTPAPISTQLNAGTGAGPSDGFLVKLDLAATPALTYWTFLGKDNDEEATAIAVDPQGNMVAGLISSSTTLLQQPFPGNSGFGLILARFPSSLIKNNVVATWLSGGDPGNANMRVSSVAMGANGDVYAAGYTKDPNLAVTRAAQTTPAGDIDAFALHWQFAHGLPAPQVGSISPTSGLDTGGTAITVLGANFQPGATVFIGAAAANNVVVANSSTITATTTSHLISTSPETVTVTNPDGSSGTLAGAFSYVGAVSPSLSSLAPGIGPASGGTIVSIGGANFLPGASVTFGGITALSIAVVNSSTILVTTPPHAPGNVDVVVVSGGQSATFAAGFEYQPAPSPQPTVGLVTPGSGPVTGGTEVVIVGNNFAVGAKVTIGGVDAGTPNVVNSTTLLVPTPAHAAGSVDVTVTNPDGTKGTLSNGFNYGGAASMLRLAAVVPGSGDPAGGQTILLLGGGFAQGAMVTMGGTPAMNVNLVSDTQMTVITPPHAKGGVDVKITGADGQTTMLANAFLYVTPPAGSSSSSCSYGDAPLGASAGLLGSLLVAVGLLLLRRRRA